MGEVNRGRYRKTNRKSGRNADAILALTLNHDSGAIGYIHKKPEFDQKSLFCINEERLNREKMTRKFPSLSIKAAKKALKFSKPAKVLIASRFTPAFVLQLLDGILSNRGNISTLSPLFGAYLYYKAIVRRFKVLASLENFLIRQLVSFKLGIPSSDIIFYDHHMCHAAAGYYSSGYSSENKESLIFTLDAEGDGASASVCIGSGKELKRLWSQDAMNGIGTFYTKVTETLGFKSCKHEGKVTGLAALGKVDGRMLRLFEEIVIFDDKTKQFSRLNHLLDKRRTVTLYKELKKFSKKDVAATAQFHLEREVTKWVSYWISKTGIGNVCFAGGISANVKLNQRIHQIDGCKNIYIFPNMGDGGIAFGALMLYLKPEPFKFDNLYLGPEYSDSEIRHALEKAKAKANLRFESVKNIEKNVAELLAKSKTVAIFNGKMEFGPRALGNRSVLYRPDDYTVNDWLNKKLKRTEFMPFAPMMLDSAASKNFNFIDGAEYPARFMTITFDCAKQMKQKCCGVVHADNTARPQLVSEKENPSCYKILKYYSRLTGKPAIINTSFNMHEEPIVCSPADAVRAFIQSGLDYMAIGNYLVENIENGKNN